MEKQTSSQARRRLLTIDEFAEALALQPKTIRQWVFRREVQFVRVQGSIRFRPETLDELIDKGTVPARKARKAAAHA
jgi:excisionase family DNA binding protein